MSDEYLKQFKNLLEPERFPSMLKKWEPLKLYQRDKYLTPKDLKLKVLNSPRIIKLLDEMSEINNDADREILKNSVKEILNEIGLEQSLYVIRGLGIILSMIMKRVYNAIYINEQSLQRVKDIANKQPVLFLPSHRSYADFILITFVCFSYDIEIPGIAAGMDFHSMIGLGTALRKTGAFFMRRKFSQDKFYWHIFKEYIHKLMTNYHKAIEFFIEGTRSRSCKSLTPKIGLLSMTLEPLFMGEVSDITIIPISVSYEKPLEEELFVYELLGIPKPKESTLGLFKAIKIIERNFGSMYFDFGKPISAKDYFGENLDRTKHAFAPPHVQTLNKNEMNSINNLAHEVVAIQQDMIVIVPFNLISYIFTYRCSLGLTTNMDQLINGVLELKELLSNINAIVALDNHTVQKTIEQSLSTHTNVIKFNNDGILEMINSEINLTNIDKRKLRGHYLLEQTMNVSIPVLTFQLYNNPLLHWLSQYALMILAAIKLTIKNNNNGFEMAEFKDEVHSLREIFTQEFVFHTEKEEMEFKKGIDLLIKLKVFTNSDCLKIDLANKYTNLIMSSVAPYFCCYYQAANIILTQFIDKEFTEHDYLVKVQENVEINLMEQKEFVHPYCLSLDTLNLSLLTFSNMQTVNKTRKNSKCIYTINENKMDETRNLLKQYCQLLPFKNVYNFLNSKL